MSAYLLKREGKTSVYIRKMQTDNGNDVFVLCDKNGVEIGDIRSISINDSIDDFMTATVEIFIEGIWDSPTT